MAHTVKRIARGPSTKVNSYAGPAGELVMDTTTNDLVLETGVQGGVRMAKASTAIAAANGISVTAGGTLGEATTISGVDATTSAKGVVQLSDATTGTSQTKAATEKAVSDALQAAKDYADQAAAGGGNYTGTAPIAVDQTTHVISADAASTSAPGVVQLSNATTGTSQTTAATEKAVADALQAAKDYTDTHGTTYTGTAPINVSGSTISVSDATAAAKGVVKVGSNISVSSGTISVAAASTSAKGVVQLDSSITASTAKVPTSAAVQAAVSSMLYNVRTVLTTSGSYTAPVTGWYKVTCIGGGGAGGSNGCRGGGGGGTTSFGSYLSASGGGGGAGSSRQNFTGGSGGGAAGDVAVTYLRLTASSSVSVTIGAGGNISTTDMTNATGTGAGTVYNMYGNAITATGAYNFGGAAKGAGNGSIIFADTGHGASGVGGNGGSNGTGYGGGGGGSTNGYYIGSPGRRGDNGADAVAKTSATGVTQCNGGNGGPGAVILEYFNPAVTA